MANLPKVSNCPMMDDETRICMCLNKKCGDDVDDKVCFAIRNSFQYGCALTERKYLNEFKGICELIVNRMNELQEND